MRLSISWSVFWIFDLYYKVSIIIDLWLKPNFIQSFLKVCIEQPLIFALKLKKVSFIWLINVNVVLHWFKKIATLNDLHSKNSHFDQCKCEILLKYLWLFSWLLDHFIKLLIGLFEDEHLAIAWWLYRLSVGINKVPKCYSINQNTCLSVHV